MAVSADTHDISISALYSHVALFPSLGELRLSGRRDKSEAVLLRRQNLDELRFGLGHCSDGSHLTFQHCALVL